MKFHLPSYVLGVITGASGAALAKRLRPLAVEIAAGAYTVADAIGVRIARGRENLSDLLAEARARARSKLQPVLHTVGA